MLQEFRLSYASAFPFVIVPPSVNGNALRRSQPFLFHAILTVTSRRQAGLQLTLSAKLREQVSIRVINHSHKSLELLQGLLVYTAWYESLVENYGAFADSVVYEGITSTMIRSSNKWQLCYNYALPCFKTLASLRTPRIARRGSLQARSAPIFILFNPSQRNVLSLGPTTWLQSKFDVPLTSGWQYNP